MKNSRIIIITVVLTLVIVPAVGLLIRGTVTASRKSKVVRIKQAQRGELVEFVSAPGEFEPKTKVEMSAKVSARFIEMPCEEGDIVTCGEANWQLILASWHKTVLASRLFEAEKRQSELGCGQLRTHSMRKRILPTPKAPKSWPWPSKKLQWLIWAT